MPTKIGGVLEILELVHADAGMRHEDLRVLLEHGRDDLGRDVLLHRRIGLEHVAAHVEVDLADRKQQPVVGLWAARQDRHIKPELGVGPVDDRLVEAAVLGLGQPIGAEGDMIGGANSGERCTPGEGEGEDPADESHAVSPELKLPAGV